MPVSIHGKSYRMVHERIALMHEELHREGLQVKIETSVVDRFSHKIICFKATITIINGDKIFMTASGHAEEVYGSSNINRTSALENAETSAIGRALAFLGYGSEEGISSYEEVKGAVEQQKKGVDISQITPDNKDKPKLIPKTDKVYSELEALVNSVKVTEVKKSDKHNKYYLSVKEHLEGDGITRFHFNSIKKTFEQWKQTKPNMFKKEK